MASGGICPASSPQHSPRKGGKASLFPRTVPWQTVLGDRGPAQRTVTPEDYRGASTSLLYCTQVTMGE